MNQELKEKLHYYLPYKLTCTIKNQPCKGETHCLRSVRDDGLAQLGEGGRFNFMQRSVDEIIPQMRPLSSLTQEITVTGYNEDKPFVPFEHIAKLEAPAIVGAANRIFNVAIFSRPSDNSIGVSYEYGSGSIIDPNYRIELRCYPTHYAKVKFRKEIMNGPEIKNRSYSWVYSEIHDYPKLLETLYRWHFWIGDQSLFDTGEIIKIEG